MADNKIIANGAVQVNNEPLRIVPNSISYKEGLGELKQKVATSGGSKVELLGAEDVSTRISEIKFEVYPTASDIEKVRSWKLNGMANVVKITAVGGFSKTFSQCALTEDPEVKLSVDGTIPVIFHGATAS